MDITFSCQKCGHAISIDDACAGLLMKCGCCGAGVVIPGENPHPLLVEQPIHAHQSAGQESARGETVLEDAPADRIEPALEPPPTDEPATPPACPFCADSIRKRRTACRVCGQPLAVSPSNRPLLRPAVLTMTLATLIVGVMLIAVLAGKSRTHAPNQLPAKPSAPTIPPASSNRPSPEKTKFLTVAEDLLRKIQSVNSATETGVALKAYVQQTAELAAVVDGLLVMVEEAGLYGSDRDVRQLCIVATATFFDFDQALNQWNLEVLLHEQKLHLQSTLDTPASANIASVAPQLEELRVRVNAAAQARADSWQHAREQAKLAETILAKLKG